MTELFWITQLGWILFSILAGPEEAAWSWPFRNISYDHFPKADKDKQSSIAHKFGWFSVVVIGVVVSVNMSAVVIQKIDLLFAFLFAIVLACEYSIMFDGSYGVSIGKNFFYIGNTAKTDQHIGAKGKLKFFVCLAIIIGLNIVLNIFW